MRARRRWRRVLLLGLGLLALALWLSPVRTIEGESMWPALRPGELVIASRLPLRPHPERDRWRPWVYRDPGTGEVLVKRLLAFEGEVVDLVGGDLLVGPTADALRRPARPAALLEPMLVPIYPRHRPDRSAWTRGTGELTVTPTGEHRLVPGRGWTHLEVALRGSVAQGCDVAREGIYDDLPAEAGGPRLGTHPVPDVRIDLSVEELDLGARLRVLHELHAEEHLALRLVAGRLEVVAHAPGTVDRREVLLPEVSLPLALRLQTLDGRWSAGVFEGVERSYRELASGPRDTLRFGAYSRVKIRVDGGAATLARIDIRRDVHYFWPHPLREARRLPAGTCLPVGDNPAYSRDGRHHGAVPTSHLIARVRARFAPWSRRGFLP